MAGDAIQLKDCTVEEWFNIAEVAPKTVWVTINSSSSKNGLGDCKTVYEWYGLSDGLRKNGKGEEAIRVHMEATDRLLSEVKMLAKYLVENLVLVGRDKESEMRAVIETVLDYIKELKLRLSKDKSWVKDNIYKNNSYFVFSDMDDEEIEYFWNG